MLFRIASSLVIMSYASFLSCRAILLSTRKWCTRAGNAQANFVLQTSRGEWVADKAIVPDALLNASLEANGE